MGQNAWTIYGYEGLLAIKDPGHQDFTVTISQYTNPVIDSNGCLTQFTIPINGAAGTTFVANENGILVCTGGLVINNNSPATRIIFQSLGEDWINLLGTTTIYGNPAELIFITPYKLNCNGCNFPSLTKVTFCTIPISSPISGLLLAADPSSYCISSSTEHSHDLYIGSKGLLSTSVMLYSYSGILNAAGPIAANGINIKTNSDITLYKEIKSNSQVYVNGGHYLIIHQAANIAAIGEINFNINILIDAHSKITSDSNIVISTGGNLILYKNAGIKSPESVSISVAWLVYFYDKSYIQSDSKITIMNTQGVRVGELYLKCESGHSGMIVKANEIEILNFSISGIINIDAKLELQSKRFMRILVNKLINHGLIKSNNKFLLYISGGIDNYGSIQSMNELSIHAHYMYLFSYSKVEALTIIIASIKESITLYNHSTFYSYGKIIVGGTGATHSQLINVISAKFGSGGDATIRSNSIIVHRSDGFKIGSNPISKTYDQYGNQWQCHVTLSCANQFLEGGDIKEAEFTIGGSLYFDGNSIIVHQSYFGVNGNLGLERLTNLEILGLSWSECVLPQWGELYICKGPKYNQNRITYIYHQTHVTFFVGGQPYGRFSGITSIAKAPNTPMQLLQPNMGYIDDTKVTGSSLVPIEHNHRQIVLQTPNPNRVVIPEDQVFDTAKLAKVPAENNNIKVTPKETADSVPLVDNLHKPLLTCEYGTADLLTSLGINKSLYPQIFASPDIEKELIKNGMFCLTGLPTIYEFTQIQDLFLQITDGANDSNSQNIPTDKACSQLKWLLLNGAKLKDQYGLVVGESLAYDKISSIEVPFAWPVVKKTEQFGEKLLLELYLPQALIKNMPAWFGPALLLGSFNLDTQGNFISTGITYVNDGAVIKATNIGLSGAFIVKNGALNLTATETIVNGTVAKVTC